MDSTYQNQIQRLTSRIDEAIESSLLKQDKYKTDTIEEIKRSILTLPLSNATEDNNHHVSIETKEFELNELLLQLKEQRISNETIDNFLRETITLPNRNSTTDIHNLKFQNSKLNDAYLNAIQELSKNSNEIANISEEIEKNEAVINEIYLSDMKMIEECENMINQLSEIVNDNTKQMDGDKNQEDTIIEEFFQLQDEINVNEDVLNFDTTDTKVSTAEYFSKLNEFWEKDILPIEYGSKDICISMKGKFMFLKIQKYEVYIELVDVKNVNIKHIKIYELNNEKEIEEANHQDNEAEADQKK
ncbi:hypothetical protein TBLA_0A07430 [Henningerozyma blattae CBS 6284]|uniref:Spindle pole body component KRE28 n=1 Tax=Henningerozyma blattae (strain ATCC 34711 / CBS 6284 / DSM 70876 / NBRC 10599 / NRRL Y-10934 / UCD 77-7) TaxID=1071380 RepID=I2GWN1_HENB6|nr:hypothetical protein TBLA_0A07430 [Tetrapisispora blattae CBS 6284]CCH58533.1 hypothetical protein TBLA_0A07430 [Tetrapisispora blattae CBS 6284]